MYRALLVISSLLHPMSIPLQNNFMKVNTAKSVLSKRKEPEESQILIAAKSVPRSSSPLSVGLETILSSKRSRSHLTQIEGNQDTEDMLETIPKVPAVEKTNPPMKLKEPSAIPKEFLCAPSTRSNRPPAKIHDQIDNDDDFELAPLVEDGGPD